MKITNDLFLSVLDCRYKASRKAGGEVGIPSDYERLTVDLRVAYRQEARQHIISSGEFVERPDSLADALRQKTPFIVEPLAESGRFRAQIDLLERIPSPSMRCGAAYVPILFSLAKVTRADKLLLAFHALALSQFETRQAAYGKIVYGPRHDTLRVKLAALLPEAQRLVDQLASMIDKINVPELMLNRHCNVCEFRLSCQAQAKEKDHLSYSVDFPKRKSASNRRRAS